jgi:predicted molibdopterin-dependent oxidoreductase YjgC
MKPSVSAPRSHPWLDAEAAGERVAFYFESRPLQAFAGESLAAALLGEGIRRLRASPEAGEPRGMFCAMGVCQECVVMVDGRTTPACQEPVRAGMWVTAKRYP